MLLSLDILLRENKRITYSVVQKPRVKVTSCFVNKAIRDL